MRAHSIHTKCGCITVEHSGPAILSFVERLSSFRGDFLQSVYESTFGLAFVGRFVLFRSVLISL